MATEGVQLCDELWNPANKPEPYDLNTEVEGMETMRKVSLVNDELFCLPEEPKEETKNAKACLFLEPYISDRCNRGKLKASGKVEIETRENVKEVRRLSPEDAKLFCMGGTPKEETTMRESRGVGNVDIFDEVGTNKEVDKEVDTMFTKCLCGQLLVYSKSIVNVDMTCQCGTGVSVCINKKK